MIPTSRVYLPSPAPSRLDVHIKKVQIWSASRAQELKKSIFIIYLFILLIPLVLLSLNYRSYSRQILRHIKMYPHILRPKRKHSLSFFLSFSRPSAHRHPPYTTETNAITKSNPNWKENTDIFHTIFTNTHTHIQAKNIKMILEANMKFNALKK